jgi:hypothetical protein
MVGWLFTCSILSVSAAASVRMPCSEVRPHFYLDGSRLVSGNDPTLLTGGTAKRSNAIFDSVAPVLELGSGVAVVSRVDFMAFQAVSSQGAIVPKSAGALPQVYRQACAQVSVFTIDGQIKMPMFFEGGTMVLEEQDHVTYIVNGGAFESLIISNKTCLMGDIKSFEGHRVFVVGRISLKMCTLNRGKPYVLSSAKRLTLVTAKSASRLLTSYRFPQGPVGRLDTALLIEN